MNSPLPSFRAPSAGERVFNRIFGFLVGLGLGFSYNHLLQVRGRKSGKIYSTPIDLLERIGCEIVGPAARLAAAVQLAQSESLDAAVLDIDIAGEMIWPVAANLTRITIAAGGSLLALDQFGWGVSGLYACVATGIVAFSLLLAFSTTRRAWTGA